jgi:outer membrane cobalamin receptor
MRQTLQSIAAAAFLWPAIVSAQDISRSKEESLLLGDIPSVFGASRFIQAVTEAPASVSVITADEIVAHGWLTLNDLLRTVRGFYTTYDRSYASVGTRGFARPGDYNSRILLLVDGIRVNENVFGAALVGGESLVDLATVERVEIIRGPASSLYGANAFFGIVNVVTQRGRAHSGVKVATELGSFGTRELSIRGAGRTRSGLEFLGSASGRRTDGQDLYFSEFDSPVTNHGVATNRDAEKRDRFFGKLEWGPLSLAGTINGRGKDVPTASFGSQFNEGRMRVSDQSGNVAVRYESSDAAGSSLAASFSLNRYDFTAVVPYEGAILTQNAYGRWGVGEVQYTRRVRGRHRLVIGGAYTRNWRLEEELVAEGQSQRLFDNPSDDTRALFASGEVRLGQRMILNGGLRYDHTPSIGGNWNPRGALIYTLGEGSALKVLYGSAFRAPNSFERLYDDGGISQKANHALTPEQVTTLEILAEKLLSRHVKVTASVYRYSARQLIDVAFDPADGLLQYNNLGEVNGQGIETEAELDLGGLSGRVSYALQRAWNPATAGRISNSPQHLGVLTLSIPIVEDRGRVGVEVRGMSSRLTSRNDVVSGYVVTNVVLSSRRLYRGIEASAGLFNIFGTTFSDPVGEQFQQNAIRQDGRATRLTLAYAF